MPCFMTQVRIVIKSEMARYSNLYADDPVLVSRIQQLQDPVFLQYLATTRYAEAVRYVVIKVVAEIITHRYYFQKFVRPDEKTCRVTGYMFYGGNAVPIDITFESLDVLTRDIELIKLFALRNRDVSNKDHADDDHDSDDDSDDDSNDDSDEDSEVEFKDANANYDHNHQDALDYGNNNNNGDESDDSSSSGTYNNPDDSYHTDSYSEDSD